MPESNKKQPTSAPELPDDTKKTLNDQGDISTQKRDEPENLPEVIEPGIDDETNEPEAEMADDEPSETDIEKHGIKKFLAGFWRHKKWTLPLTLVVIVGILLAIPSTRYPMLAPFFARDYSVEILDNKNGTPVSGATVKIDKKSVTTDSTGRAKLHAKVGKHIINIDKKYYQPATSEIFVGIKAQRAAMQIKLAATGRQVPVLVINKISGKPIKDAEVKVLDTSAKTDDQGKATIVLPTKNATETATISASGFNATSDTVHVTSEVIAGNTFQLTPSGKIYFLSNLSGSVDVVSTNLDGSGRKTVLTGTGEEDGRNTVLLAARDWKYLALLSKRDGGPSAKLFLINTSNDQLTTIDEGLANFTPIGWSDHRFVYQVNRTNVQAYQSKAQALKSYDADAGKITLLDETIAQGSQYDYVSQDLSPLNMRILGDNLLYTKSWSAYDYATDRLTGKQDQIISVDADGSGKKVLKQFPHSGKAGYQYQYISSTVYKPQDIFFSVNTGGSVTYYEYRDGNVTQTNTVTDSVFSKPYPTYLQSPSDKRTFWSESRDGKSTLFVGNATGDGGNQIASLSDYNAYGWFTDQYVLVSKSSSELYIMPVGGGKAIKVADYYKAQQNYGGYGYGYGGL